MPLSTEKWSALIALCSRLIRRRFFGVILAPVLLIVVFVATPIVIASDTDGWTALQLLGREIAVGTKSKFPFIPDRSFEASYLNMPVFVARGSSPGPTLCLTAGVHGDEPEAESPTHKDERAHDGSLSTQHSALGTPHSADHRRDAGATRAAQPPAVEVERSNILPPADGPSGLAAQPSPSGATEQHVTLHRPSNVHIFFGIYFAMTGLHGLHILAGLSVITWILIRSVKGHFGPSYYAPVDFVGLYWHLVDLIWIYLFPLLYLIH